MMPKPEVAGKCGCGRSPTGQCVGWHALTEEDYLEKLNAYLREVAEEAKEENERTLD
jgi:predicted house-cleaning noncanonical NTP pyrophosphatase (MazG superfamily)